jgi:glycosyltransferase involved in cell wall biosynthesis
LVKNNNVSPIMWVSAYPPDRGRLSEYAETLLCELVSILRFKVLVLSDCTPTKPIPYVEVKPVWKPDRLFSMLNLWIQIVKSKSKIVHFNVHLAVFGRSRITNFFGLMSVVVARLSMKKVVVTLHNISEGIKLHVVGIKNSLANRIGLTTATKIILSSAHTVVVPVKYYVKLLKKRYNADNVVWIPHGAWFTEIHPTWCWRKGKVRVLFLGYLSPYKDLKILSDAVKEIDGELIISGCPHPNFTREGKEVLTSILKGKHVKYLGYVENDRLPDLVSEISVVALPYMTPTGTSGVVHLLCGLGTPFVAFAARELRELTEEGAGILLVEMSKDALKDGIKAATKRRLAKELSKRSRLFALTRSWRKIAKIYLNIYAACLKN